LKKNITLYGAILEHLFDVPKQLGFYLKNYHNKYSWQVIIDLTIKAFKLFSNFPSPVFFSKDFIFLFNKHTIFFIINTLCAAESYFVAKPFQKSKYNCSSIKEFKFIYSAGFIT
jgi:hypothetical protein